MLLAYGTGTACAAVTVAVVVALAALGWKDFAFVIGAPGAEGALAPLGVSVLAIAIALPVTLALAIPAALCVADPALGGSAGRCLMAALRWSNGLPAVVMGVALFIAFARTMLEHPAFEIAAPALVAVNLSNATVRCVQSFSSLPPDAREAAAALGASPARIVISLVMRQTGWATAAAALALASAMLGQSAALVVALGLSSRTLPLSVSLWRMASTLSLAHTAAATGILLVLLCAALLAASQVCMRLQRLAVVAS